MSGRMSLTANILLKGEKSGRLLRLPMFYKLTADETEYIAELVKAFYKH